MSRFNTRSLAAALCGVMVLSIFGVSMALASMGQPVRTALAQATTETFCVVADARVERDDPDRNIGDGVMLQVDSPNEDGLGEMQSYLKFDVTIPAGATITSATLTLWVRPTGTNGTQHNVHVYSVSNDWTESGLPGITSHRLAWMSGCCRQFPLRMGLRSLSARQLRRQLSAARGPTRLRWPTRPEKRTPTALISTRKKELRPARASTSHIPRAMSIQTHQR